MALVELPEWVDRLSVDVAIALAGAIGITWLLLVVPDPEPIVALPQFGGLQPFEWLPVVLFVVGFPLVRRLRGPV